MEDGEVVGGEEEVDGVQVGLGVLREGASPAHQVAGPRPQGAEPTLHMAGFAFCFAATTVGSLRERGGISIPVVAAGGAVPVALG